jgi:hypothetical protein
VNRDQQFFDDTSYPVPPNVELSHCVTDEDWTSNGNYPAFETFPHYSEANFDLQLPSEKLLLISKGAFSAGNLRISTSQEDTDEVHVQVTVHYYDKAIRDLAKICLIESGDGENGVGIFVGHNDIESPACLTPFTDSQNVAQTLSSRAPLLRRGAHPAQSYFIFPAAYQKPRHRCQQLFPRR